MCSHSSCLLDSVAGDGEAGGGWTVSGGGCERLVAETACVAEGVQLGSRLAGGPFCGLFEQETATVELALSGTGCGGGGFAGSGLEGGEELRVPPVVDDWTCDRFSSMAAGVYGVGGPGVGG